MNGIERKIFTVKSPDGGLVMDTTHFPLIVVKWVGTLTNELMDRYFVIRQPYTEYGDKIGAKVVVITDVSRMNVPPATVRKYVGDKTTEVDADFKCMHAYITIIPNAIMRGVATAIGWMMGDKGVSAHTANSVDSALGMVSKIYESLGLECPVVPKGYTISDP